LSGLVLIGVGFVEAEDFIDGHVSEVGVVEGVLLVWWFDPVQV